MSRFLYFIEKHSEPLEGGDDPWPSELLHHLRTEAWHHLRGSAYQRAAFRAQRGHSLWLHHHLRIMWVSHDLPFLLNAFPELWTLLPGLISEAPGLNSLLRFSCSGYITRRDHPASACGWHLRVRDRNYLQQLCHLLGFCLRHSFWIQNRVWAQWAGAGRRTAHGAR